MAHEVCNVYSDTSHMQSARVKQGEETDTKIIAKEESEIWKKETLTHPR